MDFINPEEIRKAAIQVVRKCDKRGEPVSEHVASFILQMLIIHPDWAVQLEKKPADDVLRNLIEACEELVMSESNPVAMILKLQVYFDLNYRNADQFAQERNMMWMSKVHPVLRKLITRTCITHKEMQDMHDDIVTYVMLQENIAQPLDAKKFKDVQRTMTNLLPPSEINQFTALNRKHRKKYLQELASVVSGIYFHKWQEGRGHVVVGDAMKMMSVNVVTLLEDLCVEMKSAEELVKILEGIMAHCFVSEIFVQPEDLHDEVHYLKSFLTFLHQYRFFLDVMMRECSLMRSRCQMLVKFFKKSMEELKAGLSSTAFLPNALFSLYSKVSQNWKSIKAELVFLKHFMGVFEKMKNFRKVVQGPYDEQAVRSLEQNILQSCVSNLPGEQDEDTVGDQVMTDVTSKLQAICSLALSDDEKSIRIIYPSTVSNFGKISLEYEGFCPWALLKGNGVLIHGEPKFGILMHEGKCYAFSSVGGLQSFCTNFHTHLNAIKDILREQPQLIVLLKLQHLFNIQMCNELIFSSASVEPTFISSLGCQTVVHPVEKNRVYTYKWNQWDLRRQALKYLEIRTKKTHSTQTDLSHFRRDNFSQVYLPKNNSTQTRRNLFTVTPKDEFPVIFRDT